jgi:nucleoside-diphosphate-sugar epimerase
MPRLLVLGQGYTAGRLRRAVEAAGWHVIGTARTPRPGILAFDAAAIADAIDDATHILSSVPPDDDADPVLARYGERIAASGAWIGYLSSTGVYGDAKGAWVDETAPVGGGRRTARVAADLAWQALAPGRVHLFRLPGIYGPGRSPLGRVRDGSARRIDAAGQVFSRIHVDDIVGAVLTAMLRPAPGVYNVADDAPAPQAEVIAFACRLLGRPVPPLVPLTDAQLSAPAAGFSAESRRVANGKMSRVLGYRLRYPEYRSGLRACLLEESAS